MLTHALNRVRYSNGVHHMVAPGKSTLCGIDGKISSKPSCADCIDMLERLMAISNSVVALYVDRHGPYPELVERYYSVREDARTYQGPLPVVAHPPCGPWGRLKHMDRHGNPMLALHAVRMVRRYGGVLEHPVGSLLWARCSIPEPGKRDRYGYTLQVNQVDWGHVATKPTWLYIVGSDWLPPFPERGRASHKISGKAGGKKVCSEEQRRKTPVAFAQWLIAIAERCRVHYGA